HDLTFDAVAYTANLENHPSAVEALRRGKPVLGNSVSVLSSVRNPVRFFDFLARSGIPAPRIAFSSKVLELEPAAEWLRKPVRSGGGHGIGFHAPGDRLGRDAYLQEHLDGLSCGAVFVADGRDARLLGISEQLIGHKECGAEAFRYCGSILGPVGPGQVAWGHFIDRVEQIVGAIAREFHLVGVNGMDFILRNGLAYPLEINPRYTASMELVEQAFDINIFEAHVAACQGRLPLFDLVSQSGAGFFGKAVLFAPDGLVFHDPQWWFDRGARDLPCEGERIGAGRPICTVFSRGRSRGECYDGLIEAAVAMYRAAWEKDPTREDAV
ncbi:MAG TPA: ATP-grasp domain-containing protein, partial [Candidatus Methylomirabilis sp.]|nr:ATP-grasp domain-containing protein [Candidatus Methylomirabilis sp.]